MLDDPGEDFFCEPGGFEPFDRAAPTFWDPEDDGPADAFDPFLLNL